MKNKNLLLEKARSLVTQQIWGGVVLALAGWMILNVLGIGIWAANNGNSALNLAVSGGAMEILNAPADLPFTSGTAGTPSNQTANLNGVTVRDFRASPTAWDAVGVANTMVGQTNPNYIVPSPSIKWWPGAATVTNVETFDNVNNITKGTNNQTLNTNRNLMSSTWSKTGAVRIDNVITNVTLNGSESAQTYLSTLTMTVT